MTDKKFIIPPKKREFRSRDEQFKYLENFLLSCDGYRCEECGDVRHVDDLDLELLNLGHDVCEECAPYKKKCIREEEEAAAEMWEEGHNPPGYNGMKIKLA